MPPKPNTKAPDTQTPPTGDAATNPGSAPPSAETVYHDAQENGNPTEESPVAYEVDSEEENGEGQQPDDDQKKGLLVGSRTNYGSGTYSSGAPVRVGHVGESALCGNPDTLKDEEDVGITRAPSSQTGGKSLTRWDNHKPLVSTKSTDPIVKLWNQWLRYFMLVLNYAAVGIEPTYSGFLWLATLAAARNALWILVDPKSPNRQEEYDLLVQQYDLLIKISITPFVCANLFDDMTAVTPAEESDEFLHSMTQAVRPSNPSRTAAAISAERRAKYAKRLGYTIQILAAATIFEWGGGADALPIAALTANMQSEVGKKIIDYACFGLFIVLGEAYYMMFNGGPLENHAEKLIEIFQSKANFLKFLSIFKDSPLKVAEILLQILCYMGNRAISFMYLAGEIFEDFFKLPYANIGSKIARYATAAMHVVFVPMSRTLRVANLYLLSDAEKEAIANFLNGKSFTERFSVSVEKKSSSSSHTEVVRLLPAKDIIPDTIVSLIRGGALACLCIGLLPPLSGTSWFISIGIGALTTAHALYVRLKSNWQHNVLKLAGVKADVARITEATETKPLLSSTDIPAPSTQQQLPTTTHDTVADEFEFIQKTVAQLSEQHDLGRMKAAIYTTTFMGRVVRFISFGGFIYTVGTAAGITLTPLIIISGTFLFGAEIFKTDMAFFIASMTKFFKILHVKKEALRCEIEEAEKVGEDTRKNGTLTKDLYSSSGKQSQSQPASQPGTSAGVRILPAQEDDRNKAPRSRSCWFETKLTWAALTSSIYAICPATWDKLAQKVEQADDTLRAAMGFIPG